MARLTLIGEVAEMLRIAVLSGKGGTGKTTISASLAKASDDCRYVDCDVEEPNGFLFLKPDISIRTDVCVTVPVVNSETCVACGDCVNICQFHALALIRQEVMVFEELCHHCGACSLVCKSHAITEARKSIGCIERNANNSFSHGRLYIGEPSGVPIIRTLVQEDRISDSYRYCVLDCPPGASCAVSAVLACCDVALIVTEPTPFGVHDLTIATKLIQRMRIPAAVIINKAGEQDQPTVDRCEELHLPIQMRLPYDTAIAKAYARGILPVDYQSGFREELQAVLGFMEEMRS